MAKIITATEYHRNISEYHDTALSEPVIISRHGRSRLVLCSHQRYHELLVAAKEAKGEFFDATHSPEVEAARQRALEQADSKEKEEA